VKGVELLADAPHVARAARIVGELAEPEAVIGNDEERRPAIHGSHEVAEDPVGVDVHPLDGVAELLLLVAELPGEILLAEEVAEQVRRRVGRLDVDHQQIGLLALPQIEADLPVRVGRRQRPLEVADRVLEIEGPSELLVGDRDELRDLLLRDVRGTAREGGGLFLELGRVGVPRRVRRGLPERVLEEEVVAEVIADDAAVHRLGRPGRPISDDAHLLARVRGDVPDRLGLAHLARHGKLLARRLVHRDEMSDAMLVRRLPGGDRRPDDRAQERLRAPELSVGAALPHLREVRELPFGDQEIDHVRVGAVEPEEEHALARGASAGRESQRDEQESEDPGDR